MTDELGDMPELAAVEFPSGASPSDCKAAIKASRAYIHENDGATKTQIIDGLVPEANYPLGHNATAARLIGETDGFRQWWWREVVEPGLRALPDIDAPTQKDGIWEPVTANKAVATTADRVGARDNAGSFDGVGSDGSWSLEDGPQTPTFNEFQAEYEGDLADGTWVFADGEGEDQCWRNLDTGERCDWKRRPGNPPDGGDGHSDWLPGWSAPPEPLDELIAGQLLEVQIGDWIPELAVVMNTAADNVSIRTEYPDHLFAKDDHIAVLAVEDPASSRPVEIPVWAAVYRQD